MIELLELLRDVPESGSSILCGPRISQTSGHKLSQVPCLGLIGPSNTMVKLN